MTNPGNFDVAVIGGGAAGMVAAISARRAGASVVLLERMPRLGKKVLATGAGRCNLSNERVDASFYNPEAQGFVGSIFKHFGPQAILHFFRDLGLEFYSDGGRIFPVTDQASSVMDLLELELARLKVAVECHCDVNELTLQRESWLVHAKNGKSFKCRKAVLCGGGKSYPALGSDGSAYALAVKLGHKLVEPVPGTVPLTVTDPWCHFLQGMRIDVRATSVIEGKTVRTEPGEMLITKYGLSGTAILDVSDEISIAFHRRHVKDIHLLVDLVPFMEEEKLRDEFSKRLSRAFPAEKLAAGILPGKFGPILVRDLQSGNVSQMARFLKSRKFKVTGTRGWNEAEFTAGGIATSEVHSETLESKCRKGLYLAGEILDVNGRRGGYNLAWAWASGFVAGHQAGAY
jgi:predicted Rossmann fold flavoprotein